MLKLRDALTQPSNHVVASDVTKCLIMPNHFRIVICYVAGIRVVLEAKGTCKAESGSQQT